MGPFGSTCTLSQKLQTHLAGDPLGKWVPQVNGSVTLESYRPICVSVTVVRNLLYDHAIDSDKFNINLLCYLMFCL